MPHSLEAERGVLGGIVLDPEVINEIEPMLAPEDFYRRSHRLIYEAMLRLSAENQPIDLVTLTERLKAMDALETAGGVEYLASLDSSVPTAFNAVSYARLVKEKATLRRLITAANSIVSEGLSGPEEVREFLEEAEQSIFKVTQEQDDRALTTIKDVTLTVFEILQQRFEAKSEITGIGTGYVDLDRKTAGLQRGDLIILAARPSMGKTAFALNIAANAALRNDPPSTVAIFSLEMSMESLVMRMLAAEARVRSDGMRTGRLLPNEWSKLATAAGKLSEAALFIDDTPAISLSQLRSKCRRLQAKHGLDLIVVDYLQLMRGPKSDSREQEISAISRGLKGLAKDLNVPVLALSQLNRALERRENKRPQLSDLRESGAIEQDADVILFIHREDRYRQGGDVAAEDEGLAEILVAKQRNGPTGKVELVFFSEYTRFDNYERLHPAP
ncbi:MAG: replicative DNA helicase [Deltaproteobacteria bacterium]|nr:MAG: replicative DNA helicase [Deltaproteobacteria bacterium]